MRQIPFQNLACPIDLEPLKIYGSLEGQIRQESFYKCVHNHSFDVARAGYVNLLPSQFKHSKNPGDQKQMVAARTAFLNSGAYKGVLQALFGAVKAYISDMSRNALSTHQIGQHALNIIDAGCGEGYYTVGLAQKLVQDSDPDSFSLSAFAQESGKASFSIFGYDISKEAVTAAAKRDKDISWAVATTARMPVLSRTADMVLCLFGFPVWAEFDRVLKPNGQVILIDAGVDHLIELRERMYDTVYKKQNASRTCDGFECVNEQEYKIPLENLSAEQVADLIKMTPHYYRMNKDKFNALIANVPPCVTLNFRVSCYSRQNGRTNQF